jgi:SAM-dependent methyltransferase
MTDGAATFRVPPDAYERFMGRWSHPLAVAFADAVGAASGPTAIDVGCGTGALTRELVRRLGGRAVAAVDPSEPSVAACAAAAPEADVRVGNAETLPFGDASFDLAVSQLVVNFMTDPVLGVREMRRVTRPGGTVASCTWDYGDGMTMLRVFWDAAVALDPSAPDEALAMSYCTPTDLERLWDEAGLAEIRTDALVVERSYVDFEDLWEPFTFGVGPAGTYCASLDGDRREALRRECFRRFGEPVGPLSLTARAWLVCGRA